MGYNGWTNYETWVVKLWIDNEEDVSTWWLERAEAAESAKELADELEETHRNFFSDEYGAGRAASVYSDLMNSALDEVNWREIAEVLLEEAKDA